MVRCRFTIARFVAGLAAVVCLISAGCFGHHEGIFAPPPPPPSVPVPTELSMIQYPPYVVAAPDILLIDVVTDSFDVAKPPKALTPQPISGQHLVHPDGSVHLGMWGTVPVAGLSLEQATEAIRLHVYNVLGSNRKRFVQPDTPEKILVVVDVLAYNSKLYYIIADGAGYGEQIFPFPCTGNETVLDALSKINGLPELGSKRNIWVARRCPIPGMQQQILPVDYVAITQQGITCTNYQLFPGDRIYVKAQTIFWVDRFLQKVLTPIERILGVTLLGSTTWNSIKTGGLTGGTP